MSKAYDQAVFSRFVVAVPDMSAGFNPVTEEKEHEHCNILGNT